MSIIDLFEMDNIEKWNGVFREVECRRALSPSGLPGMDYALNPYGGCEHGCVYCYAPEVTHSEWSEWRIVKVRRTIASRLAAELPGLSGRICIGSVTDPYQPAEARFCLTKQCLEVLKGRGFKVSVLTKSPLVLRDLALLKEMDVSVGMTVNNVDVRAARMTEPGAALPAERITALRKLVDEGIDAFVMAGPILTTLEGHEEELTDAIVSTGVRRVEIDRLNGRTELNERLGRMGIEGSPRAVSELRRLLANAGLKVSDAF